MSQPSNKLLDIIPLYGHGVEGKLKTKMKKRIIRRYTIGRVLLEFSNERLPICAAKYSGQAQTIPYDMAAKIAEYHPSCVEYYAAAMMPLYKGYSGPYRRGTECPVSAVSSRSELEFVRISVM